LQEKFTTFINEHEVYIKENEGIFNLIGYIKLILVAALAALIIFMAIRQFTLVLILISLGVFIVLAVLWIYHNKLNDKIDYSKGIIAICNRQIDRIVGKWSTFEDIGSEFVDTSHAYACDLDIVGKKSLFQFLNTTHTWHGRQAFANDLLRPTYLGCDLHQRQEAITELSSDIVFSSKIQYYLSRTGANSSDLLEDLRDKTPFTRFKSIRLILTFIPLLTILFSTFLFIFQLTNLYSIVVLLVAIQAAAWAIGVPKLYRYLNSMTHLPSRLSAYNIVISILKDHNFSSEKLNQIKTELNSAAKPIRTLSSIASRINIKHNFLIYFFLNIVVLWDYECAFSLQEWKRKYAHLAENWFQAIGEFESLLSFSHLPNICNTTCLPEISEKEGSIDANGFGHPLLLNEKRVSNEFKFNDNVFIISGSNMSGKTTLLRTVGINVVLARSGSYVCAEKMVLSPLDVITSMRISDDLNEGVSTFYAELRRIKKILDVSEQQPATLFLIDEIFKGTNSIDRLIGAKTVIKTLNKAGAIGLVSTHDLELCELSSTFSRIKNYHFIEHYKDNKILFDYKMRTGISNTSNAKYLMEMVGIHII